MVSAVNGRMLWVLVVVLLGCIVAAAIVAPFFASSPGHPAGPAGLAGEPAPTFALQDDAGAPVSLAGYRGKVVVMNLWASWCPPCRAEMPELQQLADAYATNGVVVVGVNQGESPQRARAFAQALHIHFPIWIDDHQRYGRTYTAMGLPTTVIVGRDGKVVRGFDGALTFAQMRAALAGLVPKR